MSTATATPTKKTVKKKSAAPTAAAPASAAPAKKKVMKKGSTVVHIASESAEAQTIHGVALNSGLAKKPGKRGVVSMLVLSQIELIDGFNPRGNVGDIEALAQSIKAEGLLSGLVVRPSKKEGKFELIAGERRYRALKSLKWDEPFPCLIRPDLAGDDDRALAVALAENSEDGRTNLNMIEIGRACVKLEKQGWPVARIAKETGLHSQRVRRSLELMRTPEEVQKNVEKGKWSAHAGLEFAKLDVNKLDDKTRAKIKSQIDSATTAEDIKRIRKEVEKDEVAKNIATGKGATKLNKSGKPSKRGTLTTWRGSREKQETLQELCYLLQNADPSDVGTPGWHEVRGAIGLMLWDRGDRTEPIVPDLEPDKKDENYAALMKDLTVFNASVKAAAAQHAEALEEEAASAAAES